jgi:hypothetical protein
LRISPAAADDVAILRRVTPRAGTVGRTHNGNVKTSGGGLADLVDHHVLHIACDALEHTKENRRTTPCSTTITV